MTRGRRPRIVIKNKVKEAALSSATACRLLKEAARSPRGGHRKAPILNAAALSRIRSLWHAAYVLFQERSKAERFMTAPHPLLGMVAPIECVARSVDGAESARAIVLKLKHGTAA